MINILEGDSWVKFSRNETKGEFTKQLPRIWMIITRNTGIKLSKDGFK